MSQASTAPDVNAASALAGCRLTIVTSLVVSPAFSSTVSRLKLAELPEP